MAYLAENLCMSIAVKKASLKHQKPVGKRAAKLGRPAIAKPVDGFDAVADAEECERISRALDIDAFDAFHKRNKAARRNWETRE